MDDATFATFASRYRVVRSRDAFVPERAARAGAQAGASASARGGARAPALGAPAAAAPAARPLPPPGAGGAAKGGDFWAQLQAFLDARYAPAQAKAVAAAFDELHYTSAKALNYEDIEDVAAMLAREAGLPPFA